MENTTIQPLSNPYLDAIMLAEAQLKKATDHLEYLEKRDNFPGKARKIEDQRKAVSNLHSNLVGMKTTCLTLFDVLPSLP